MHGRIQNPVELKDAEFHIVLVLVPAPLRNLNNSIDHAGSMIPKRQVLQIQWTAPCFEPENNFQI